MLICWKRKNKYTNKRRLRWVKAEKWHLHFLWWPKILKVGGEVSNNRKCFVWLRYVQRRTTDGFYIWVDYPSIRSYKYKL